MRQLLHEQLPLAGPTVEHSHAQELEVIDRILSKNAGVVEWVLQDLERGVRPGRGRSGMTANQVLRVAIVKQLNGFTYDELVFRLADSWTYRTFCGFGCLRPIPGASTLQRNIKRITAETWEAINRALMRYAAREGVEKGRTVRVDATVTPSNVHAPTDSSLLWDSVRVLTRLNRRAHEGFGVRRYPSRRRRAKRRALEVLNAKVKRKRTKAYRDLLVVTRETVEYARRVTAELRADGDVLGLLLATQIEGYLPFIEAVIDQTERRVIHGEAVPAEDKILSIFETHTDIIIKDNRATHYGHKVTLSAGRSGLVLDWVVEDGNPADSTTAMRMLTRLQNIYGRVPRQAAFDGGYASKANLAEGKRLGVEDLVFSKKRGLKVPDMARSDWVYKRLRNFRAGIEAWISFLKRCMGLDRCTWKGWPGFAQYVGASIVTANLLTLARLLL